MLQSITCDTPSVVTATRHGDVTRRKALNAPGVTSHSSVSQANNTVKTPGVGNLWSMPTTTRLDMLATDIKTPLDIKVFRPRDRRT